MRGGGLYAVGVQNVIVRNSVFSDNQAFLGGAAAYLEDSTVVFENVLFTAGNSGPSGGPGVEVNGGRVEFVNARFLDNEPGLANGGLGVQDAELEVRDSEFLGGSAGMTALISITGGANATATLTNVVFADIGASEFSSASAIYGDDASIVITNATFVRNGETGGGLAAPDIYAGVRTQVYNVLFHHQFGGVAWDGGAMVSNECQTYDGLGGEPPVILDQDGDGFPEYYLNNDSGCIDIGDNAAAQAAGLPWESMTTQRSGCLDTNVVDAGRHDFPLSDAAGPCP